jgi:hypothetical protein
VSIYNTSSDALYDYINYDPTLFDRLNGVFSFYVWDFKQANKLYSIFFNNSPGWFEPDYLNAALTKLRKN